MADDKPRNIQITIPMPEELLSLFIPADAQAHLRGAKKEMLLALRSMIDARIEALERQGKKRARTAKKIKVE
ncbi:MAG TPA: hypothetical protein PLX50_03645 [Candidatus Aminicenantes bacterium]|nr:hypothetical protein [Candidatus Aminicenantes bacterium]